MSCPFVRHWRSGRPRNFRPHELSKTNAAGTPVSATNAALETPSGRTSEKRSLAVLAQTAPIGWRSIK
jgi:hypothetical protein